MAGQATTGNVIAALCSFIIPGLGQLLQGRPWKAVIHFVIDCILWIFWLGWIMHLWSAFDAAVFGPKYDVYLPDDRYPA